MTRYEGPATLAQAGQTLGEVAVTLTLDPPVPGSALRGWRGRVTDAGSVDLWPLAGEQVVLRLPNGAEGTALFVTTDGSLSGNGAPPDPGTGWE